MILKQNNNLKLGRFTNQIVAFPELFMYFNLADDEVAEWLRRWTANPLRSTCVGSNPILVENFLFTVTIIVYGVCIGTIDHD